MLGTLHGAVGWLDEILAFGILIAIGLGIYFVFALIEWGSKKKTDTKDETH